MRFRKYIGETRPEIAGTNRGFREKTEIGGTQILIPKNKKESSRYQQEVARKRFRARAAIEPTISYLKRNHALGLNFIKGVAGDIHNALLAAIGYNLKLRFNQIKVQIAFWFIKLFNISTQNNILIFVEIKNNPF